jgi:hypothetical protein
MMMCNAQISKKNTHEQCHLFIHLTKWRQSLSHDFQDILHTSGCTEQWCWKTCGSWRMVYLNTVTPQMYASRREPLPEAQEYSLCLERKYSQRLRALGRVALNRILLPILCSLTASSNAALSFTDISSARTVSIDSSLRLIKLSSRSRITLDNAMMKILEASINGYGGYRLHD